MTSIEVATRGQADNPQWKRERGIRLTASRFGEICKATANRDFKKLALQYVNPKEFRSRATDHGKSYEAVAIKTLSSMYGKIEQCGLFVSANKPWLGASPDGILNDGSIVEVKCPYSSKDKKINDVTIPFLKKTEASFELKLDHDYYFQVQGQLYCCNATRCYFGVYTLKDFLVLDIRRNDAFIEKMLEKLERFYLDYFQSAVIEKNVYRSYYNFFG